MAGKPLHITLVTWLHQRHAAKSPGHGALESQRHDIGNAESDGAQQAVNFKCFQEDQEVVSILSHILIHLSPVNSDSINAGAHISQTVSLLN